MDIIVVFILHDHHPDELVCIQLLIVMPELRYKMI